MEAKIELEKYGLGGRTVYALYITRSIPGRVSTGYEVHLSKEEFEELERELR